MQQSCTYGSVRGAPGNRRPYRDKASTPSYGKHGGNGTSAKALKTQNWTALIARLAVKFLQLQATFSWSLSMLVALLRQQLFVYRDLWRWLETPFEPPVELTPADSPQLPLLLQTP